jgi:SpoVK/Ycf46/Vps4 family AAA+-type ATPase
LFAVGPGEDLPSRPAILGFLLWNDTHDRGEGYQIGVAHRQVEGGTARPMTITAEHVKALVRRHIDRDDEGFNSIALQLAARAAREGKSRFAQDLRELIESAQTPKAADQLRPTPIAQPRGELAGLMSVSYPDVPLEAMTLAPKIRDQFSRVLTEQRQRDRLTAHGLDPIHRILLVGPPGTGKSMSAAVLAHELRLPLFTIQLDVLISKYMGETAAKLRHVFDAVASTRAVYLFDEFDALGTQRMAGNDVGEARRVLNSFLQFLEGSSPASLVVAATNHPQLLDKALYRRFDQVIEYGLPDPKAAVEVIKNRLTLLDASRVQWPALEERTTGLSHADLVRVAEGAAKQVLLAGRKRITTTVLVSVLEERRRHADD